MPRRLPRLLGTLGLNKDVMQITAANIISASLGAVFWIIIANLLSAEEYGQYNYYVAIAAISSSLAILGLDNTVTTYVPKGVQNVIAQSNTLLLVSEAITAVALFLLFNNWVISFLLVSIVTFSMSTSLLLGKKSFREYSLLLIGQRVLQICLSIVLYFYLGINGILVGYSLAYLFLSYRYFYSLKLAKMNFDSIKTRWRFVVHSYFTNLSAVITTSADKIIIGPVFGFAILGYYQLAFQFLALLSILPVTLFHYLLPMQSSGVDNKRIKLTGIVISIILSFVIITISPLVITTIFPKFTESILAAQIIGVGIIPLTLISILQSTMLSKERSKEIFLSSAIYLISLLALILTIGIRYGLVGLAISLIIALCIQSSSLIIFNRLRQDPSKNASKEII